MLPRADSNRGKAPVNLNQFLLKIIGVRTGPGLDLVFEFLFPVSVKGENHLSVFL